MSLETPPDESDCSTRGDARSPDVVPPVDTEATRHSLLSRIKDWEDQGSWREFFDTYWRLIYATATRAGLRHEEAQEVVQETIFATARKIGEFKTNRRHGSFKAWLLQNTRWRIADQLRKRPPPQPAAQPPEGPRTSTVERIEDPANNPLDHVWDEEWEKNLLQRALENVKARAKPELFQIFHLLTSRRTSARQVAQRLHVNLARVYYAQYIVGAQVKRELQRLQRTDP